MSIRRAWNTVRTKTIKIIVAIPICLIIVTLLVIFGPRSCSKRTIKGASESSGLGIDKVIRDVKKELVASDQKRIENQEAALFQVKDFDLEIQFVVRESTTTGGEAKYEVITVNTELKDELEKVQKITLHFTAAQPKEEKEKVTENPNPGINGPITNVDLPPPSRKAQSKHRKNPCK